jgi:hypothetical protein
LRLDRSLSYQPTHFSRWNTNGAADTGVTYAARGNPGVKRLTAHTKSRGRLSNTQLAIFAIHPVESSLEQLLSILSRLMYSV